MHRGHTLSHRRRPAATEDTPQTPAEPPERHNDSMFGLSGCFCRWLDGVRWSGCFDRRLVSGLGCPGWRSICGASRWPGVGEVALGFDCGLANCGGEVVRTEPPSTCLRLSLNVAGCTRLGQARGACSANLGPGLALPCGVSPRVVQGERLWHRRRRLSRCDCLTLCDQAALVVKRMYTRLPRR